MDWNWLIGILLKIDVELDVIYLSVCGYGFLVFFLGMNYFSVDD